jgi:alpha-glucosidase (family GH31 glycosyl hydrolase)
MYPMKFCKKNACCFLVFILSVCAVLNVKAQETIRLNLLPGEQWWGGAGQYGNKMPFNGKSNFNFNLYGDNSGNQSQPLLISNKGRWIWSNEPIQYIFKNDSLVVISQNKNIQNGTAGNSIATAYRFVATHFFPSSGNWPDSLLVTAPQYNLWIELQYNPNQKDVLHYAENLLKNNFLPGVLMIDDNWSNYYGEFNFNKVKFPDAKKTIAFLHAKGFKVMLWICPFITPDSENFRELYKRKLLLMDNEGDSNKTWKDATKPLLIQWWNGYSACLDFTNPGAKEWLIEKLKFLQTEYGVDGYKFDAGDANFYDNKKLLSFENKTPNEHSEEWAKMGLSFPLNEYRAMWKMAGQPLVQRLGDKSHNWYDLQMLIPNTIAQQLMGYTFTCPDMIGGGQIASFMPGAVINQKLMVRSAQLHALMPMMQFSVAPWRVLDAMHLNAIKVAVDLRQRMMPQLMSIMRRAVNNGEPVVRPLEYNYPNQGYENIKDEFMLGNDILVAPIVTENDERNIVLPQGEWIYQNKKWKGGETYTLKVGLEDVPVFVRKSNKINI